MVWINENINFFYTNVFITGTKFNMFTSTNIEIQKVFKSNQN